MTMPSPAFCPVELCFEASKEPSDREAWYHYDDRGKI